MSSGMAPWSPPSLPAGWTVVRADGEWVYGLGTPIRMVLELVHANGSLVRVELTHQDQWAWIERVLLPATAAIVTPPDLAVVGMRWEAHDRW